MPKEINKGKLGRVSRKTPERISRKAPGGNHWEIRREISRRKLPREIPVGVVIKLL